MNDKKIIIQNCPSFIDFDEQSLFENLCKNGGNCQDCTDCAMKQIVEKCKERINIADGKADLWDTAIGDFAQDILRLLKIEEVE